MATSTRRTPSRQDKTINFTLPHTIRYGSYGRYNLIFLHGRAYTAIELKKRQEVDFNLTSDTGQANLSVNSNLRVIGANSSPRKLVRPPRHEKISGLNCLNFPNLLGGEGGVTTLVRRADLHRRRKTELSPKSLPVQAL